jgi:hypothetical protein
MGSGLGPVAGFGISDVENSGSVSSVLVNQKCAQFQARRCYWTSPLIKINNQQQMGFL